MCHYLSDKSFLTVTEDGIKHLIILFKDSIKHLSLQPWLELNKHLRFFDDGIIILELLIEEHPCHVTCVGIKMNVFTNFAHWHHPVVNALLLLVDFGLCLDLSEERLKTVDHVTVEGDTYHFNADGEEEFRLSVAFDVTVPNTSKCCYNPINRSNIVAPIIQLLHIIHIVLENPSIIILKKLSISNQHPLTSKEMADKTKYYYSVPYFNNR